MRNREARFRRSPHLVCYWAEGQLVFHNFAAAKRVAASPLTAQVLDFFDRWRPVRSLFSRFPEYSRVSLRHAVASLVKHSLLERSDRPRDPRARALDPWKAWNPVAGFFHMATKDAPFTRQAELAQRRFIRYARAHPMPPATKRYPRAPSVALPAPATAGEFPRVLLGRRTWRQFAPRPLALTDLATLLGLTWRVQRWVRAPGLRPLALKTSPSGGSLHPIEVYVLARRVLGLAHGLYHYDAAAHRLERLRRGPSATGQTADYLPGQWWFGDAAAIFLMTAVFARSQWRYAFARTYRVILAEAGHLCQTFCLVATWLGLAPFCTMALADSKIERDLGIDGVSESVLYVAGVGARPPGVSWAPWPEKKRNRQWAPIRTGSQKSEVRSSKRGPGPRGHRAPGGAS